jgi:hypothetical protein
MKRTKALLTMLALFGLYNTSEAQKYKSKMANFEYYEYPKVALNKPAYSTYSVTGNLPDYMGGGYALARMTFDMSGLKRSPQQGGDIEILLNFAYYTEDPYARPTLQKGSKTVKVNGRDTSVPVYNYQGGFNQPYEYTMMDNAKGNTLFTFAGKGRYNVATDWYSNSDEAMRNWETTLRTQVAQQSGNVLREASGVIQTIATRQFYTGSAKGQAEIMYMKDKEEYADLDSAFQIAISAYPLIAAEQKGQHDSFAVAIAPAEIIWQRALAQYAPDSKKARINGKAANLILFNLAYAAYWKNDFSAATGYAEKAGENDKRDGWVNGFIEKVKDRKERLRNSDIQINK